MVKVVVQNGDERRIECQVLLKGPLRSLHLESDAGNAVGEKNVGAIGFFRLCAPVIADGCAIRLQRQGAGNFTRSSLGRLDLCGAFGKPSAAGGSNFKFFTPDSLSAESNAERALIRGKYNSAGRRR